MQSESKTTEISKENKPQTFNEITNVAQQGHTIAGNTRKEIEEKTNKNWYPKLHQNTIQKILKSWISAVTRCKWFFVRLLYRSVLLSLDTC
jgi:hypothetical protein